MIDICNACDGQGSTSTGVDEAPREFCKVCTGRGIKHRLYIAGPMTGLPDLNFPAFHAAAAKYRARGATVFNPAEINPDPGMKWEDAMRADIALLVTCDTIVMLDGWTRSRGASLEHHIAVSLSMTVIHPE